MLVATINFTFRDSKKKESTTKIRVPAGVSFANIVDFAQAAAQVIANMSTAELIEVSASVGLDLSGASLKTVATQFSDVFNKAFIQARNAVSGLLGKFNIPTYDDANNLANSDVLDPADVEVAALETLIEDGVTVGAFLVYPTTPRGEALSEVTLAVEKFRKS